MIQPSFPMVSGRPCAFPMISYACRIPHKVAVIQRAVAEMFGLRVGDMVSARRERSVARPRQVAMYLARDLTPQSLPEIGRRFGNRDHTTVMHAIKAVEARMALDPSLRADVAVLRARLAV